MIVEGFFLIHRQIIWVVKGVDVCEGHVIAFPRYDIRGRKLSYEVIAKLIKTYSRASDCSPRPSPLVPLAEAEVIDPRDLIDADRIAKDMASIFSCEAGLTGSRAWGSGNDIDLIFYGEECVPEVLRVMKELRENGVTKPPSEGKWDGLGMGARRYRMSNSLLEGIWGDIPYSFRIVSGPRSPRRPTILRRVNVCGYLTPISNIALPYTYELHVGNTKIKLESLRMQHSEIGEVAVCVEGTLESRIDGMVLTLPPSSKLDVLN